MLETSSTRFKFNIMNYIKIFQIPFFSLLLIANNLIIYVLDLTIIPSHELLVMIFTFILLLNTSSIIQYFDKSNFNIFSKHFNHWITIFFTFFNRMFLLILLFFLAFLLINMIYMEFEFGTIFVAKTNWEYSWILKTALLCWIFIICFNSINSLKSLLLPFSKKPKK